LQVTYSQAGNDFVGVIWFTIGAKRLVDVEYNSALEFERHVSGLMHVIPAEIRKFRGSHVSSCMEFEVMREFVIASFGLDGYNGVIRNRPDYGESEVSGDMGERLEERMKEMSGRVASMFENDVD